MTDQEKGAARDWAARVLDALASQLRTETAQNNRGVVVNQHGPGVGLSISVDGRGMQGGQLIGLQSIVGSSYHPIADEVRNAAADVRRGDARPDTVLTLLHRVAGLGRAAGALATAGGAVLAWMNA